MGIVAAKLEFSGFEMSDFLSNGFPKLAVIGSCYVASFSVFAWFEDRLSSDRKKELTALIKSADTFAVIPSM